MYLPPSQLAPPPPQGQGFREPYLLTEVLLGEGVHYMYVPSLNFETHHFSY